MPSLTILFDWLRVVWRKSDRTLKGGWRNNSCYTRKQTRICSALRSIPTLLLYQGSDRKFVKWLLRNHSQGPDYHCELHSFHWSSLLKSECFLVQWTRARASHFWNAGHRCRWVESSYGIQRLYELGSQYRLVVACAEVFQPRRACEGSKFRHGHVKSASQRFPGPPRCSRSPEIFNTPCLWRTRSATPSPHLCVFSLLIDQQRGWLRLVQIGFNQIDLPQYTSYEMLRQQLLMAINEGGEGFAFSWSQRTNRGEETVIIITFNVQFIRHKHT